MKILVASDIHGSAVCLKKLLEFYKNSGAEKLVLLGDIFYHGPRNPLPEGYNPMETAELLSDFKKELIVVKGNCDSEVDAMIAPFDFADNAVLFSGSKKIFFSHGHNFNAENPPKGVYDAVFYGHFHIGLIERDGSVLYVNPGSVSLPKDGRKSFVMIDNNTISLYSLNGKKIKEETL